MITAIYRGVAGSLGCGLGAVGTPAAGRGRSLGQRALKARPTAEKSSRAAVREGTWGVMILILGKV